MTSPSPVLPPASSGCTGAPALVVSSRQRVLVLGGGYAGVLAAARIARERGAWVTLVDPRPAMVQRIRMHELLAGREPATLCYDALSRHRGVEFLRGVAEEIRLGAQTVQGTGANGRPWHRHFDALVIALGSRTALPVPGTAANARRLDRPSSVRRTRERLARMAPGRRVVVVGGGATGIETVAELAEQYSHLRLTLLSATPLGATYDPGVETHLRATLARLGVRVLEGRTVAAVGERELQLADGESVAHDLCVWAAGFEATPLARAAGLGVTPQGRAIVDGYLRAAGHANVFVAGDAAAVRQGEAFVRMGCATAMPMGAHVGTNVRRYLNGQPLEPFRFGFSVRCTSLGRRDGLIQFTEADDRPSARFLTRRPAAVVKELVSRSTLWAAKAEARTGLPVTRWRRPPDPA